MSAPDEIPINTPTIQTPSIQQGVFPTLIDDIIPPRYPNGCELLLMRPGELAPVVPKIPIPAGSMILMYDPQIAAMIRPVILEAVRKAREQIQRERAARNGMGQRS